MGDFHLWSIWSWQRSIKDQWSSNKYVFLVQIRYMSQKFWIEWFSDNIRTPEKEAAAQSGTRERIWLYNALKRR